MRFLCWIFLGCLIGLLPPAALGQSNDMQTRLNELLKRIIPIEATAEDVKKLLGEPISKSPDFHEFDDFNVLVSYTTGVPCDKEPTYGWNVPRGKVNTFAIIIKAAFHQKNLKDLGIDLKKYRREDGGHIPESSYVNDEQGITIIINGDQVESIDLFPAKKYLHLMCSKAAKTPAWPEDAIVNAQDRPVWLHPWDAPEQPLNCEENIIHLEIIAELTSVERPRDGVLIVIARLGDGERSQELNRRRLYNVRVALMNNRQIDPQRLIMTSGERVRGYGRVEFYLGGKLMGGLRVARGKDLCVACCDIDERYYPYLKNKKRMH